MPLLVWLAGYVVALIYFVPRIEQRSAEMSEARSMLTGRIVDSYTNIATVKLFAHTDREDDYARGAFSEFLDRYKQQLRLNSIMEVVLWTLNGFVLVATTWLAIWLWTARPGDDRRHRARDRARHPPDEHVGLVHVDARRHLRQHRRRAGEHG